MTTTNDSTGPYTLLVKDDAGNIRVHSVHDAIPSDAYIRSVNERPGDTFVLTGDSCLYDGAGQRMRTSFPIYWPATLPIVMAETEDRVLIAEPADRLIADYDRRQAERKAKNARELAAYWAGSASAKGPRADITR